MDSKKCIAVHLPLDLLDKINEQKLHTGQNQSQIIIELLEKGLGYSTNKEELGKHFYFMKVRIDLSKMNEFGEKLQNGNIDTSHTLVTYCLQQDPTVGLNFWYADSLEELDEILQQYKPYYKEIIEVVQVITPMNAMQLIMAQN